ncbi:OmpA family protein [Flexibacter flexilis]|uniref:OmpA family protein n=1 Tax=Flexibacter flexilis TaxID=998 RepID=UPI001C86C938|nr:OmpA family protein [Flexibacter flexilis]
MALAALLGSCASPAQKYAKKGDKSFKKGEYAKAVEYYQQALAKNGNAGYLNNQIAESYWQSNKVADAEPFYKAAIDAGVKADSVLFHYGYALKSKGKYEEAKNAFSQYAQNGTKPALVERAKREVANYGKVEEILRKQPVYAVQNVDSLNTSAAEYGPSLQNGELYFTSSRGASKMYAGTGTGFTDIYKLKFDGLGKNSGTVTPLDKAINDPSVHDASATISRDGKTMVFARSNDGSKKGLREVNLFVSRYKDGKWTDAEPLTEINKPDAWTSSPAFSPDGKSLYFASNREGGKGGVDLYRAQLDANGRWSKITNLGDQINTSGDELFPYVSEDGKLYFSSDGLPGLGNLDVFVATRDKDKKTTVENLGAPINSTGDDFGITFRSPLDGYFSSNREGGKGDDDIYAFSDIKSIVKNVSFVLAGTAVEKNDKGEEVVVSNAKVALTDNDGKTLAEVTTGADGKFSFPLDRSRNYNLLTEKPEYFTKRDAITTIGKQPAQEELRRDTTVTLDAKVLMDKIKVDKEIVLNNIYYDFNKADIRDDAKPELDVLVQLLKDNPNVSIELSSHTDDRGDHKFNQNLSQKRAESAVAYIVSNGVEATRITAKGYGETHPLIENAATEEDYQKNRRTEFKVTKVAKAAETPATPAPTTPPAEEKK